MTAFSTPSRFAFNSGRLLAMAVACSAALLVGCGGKNKDKPASQTAAKVNKEEITVHQINFVLQQRGIAGSPTLPTSKQVLDRLVDQELAIQQAQEQKLERDPRIVQQLEAARRDILARAYLEKVGATAPKPTAEEVKVYYDAKPALFKERRIYSLQELVVEAKPEQVEVLRAKVLAAQDVNEFVTFLKANGYKFAGNQETKAAEQLPLSSLDAFARMKDGQALFNAHATGVQVVFLAGSRSQPVDEERAKPAIEQFLLNERRRKIVDDDIKALRAAAKIEYVGEFASAAASAPVATAASPIASEPAFAASGPDAASMEKGLTGLK